MLYDRSEQSVSQREWVQKIYTTHCMCIALLLAKLCALPLFRMTFVDRDLEIRYNDIYNQYMLYMYN